MARNLDALPVVVTGPGRYRTRSGHEVVIYNIVPGTSTFEAKGSLIRATAANPRRRPAYDIWHVSGRHLVVGESPRDLLEKIESR